MRCFYSENLKEGEIILTGKELAHIFKVNKLKENEKILLTDCQGKTAIAHIQPQQKIFVETITEYNEPTTKVHLFLSTPRKNQLDQIVTQCCEIAVWSINLLITERSIAIPTNEQKIDRLREKVIEGCKQSHNPFAPKIYPPIPLKSGANQIKQRLWSGYFGACIGEKTSPTLIKTHQLHGSFGNINLPLNERQPNSSANHQQQLMDMSRDIAWIVGPEGGFSKVEEEFLVAEGIRPLAIGQTIMRVETAAIVGAAMLGHMSFLCNFNRNLHALQWV